MKFLSLLNMNIFLVCLFIQCSNIVAQEAHFCQNTENNKFIHSHFVNTVPFRNLNLYREMTTSPILNASLLFPFTKSRTIASQRRRARTTEGNNSSICQTVVRNIKKVRIASGEMSSREFKRTLRSLGVTFLRNGLGSHEQWGLQGCSEPVPHGSIRRGTRSAILKRLSRCLESKCPSGTEDTVNRNSETIKRRSVRGRGMLALATSLAIFVYDLRNETFAYARENIVDNLEAIIYTERLANSDLIPTTDNALQHHQSLEVLNRIKETFQRMYINTDMTISEEGRNHILERLREIQEDIDTDQQLSSEIRDKILYRIIEIQNLLGCVGPLACES